MVNRILLAAILCAGASLSVMPMAPALADEATTAADPALDLADQPTSDADLQKQAGTPPHAAAVDANGLLLPSATAQSVGPSLAVSNGGNTTVGISNSLTAVSTLSATIDSNGIR